MAAGLGFKDFTTGEVLTAADVDGYLMQGVWVFASAAARDAAVTSPQEGNFAYLKDTNVTTYYTGSAWANLDTTGMTNPMTTTGDTIYSSSGSTPARLGIGSTGNVLTVAGGVPTWAAPAGGGGMTLLETLTFSGASVTSSSIAGTYKNLEIIVRNFKPASDSRLNFRLNSDTGTNYEVVTGNNEDQVPSNSDKGIFGDVQDNTTATGLLQAFIPDYANTTTVKLVLSYGIFNNFSTATFQMNRYANFYDSTSAITTITFYPNTGNFTSGEALIYGVK
jgi:hypothetical protein